MKLKEVLHQNRFFMVAYLAFLAVAITILLTFSKVDGHIFLNRWHSPTADSVFIALTSLGDGLFVISLAVILFLFRHRFLSLLIMAAYLSSGLLVQVIKLLYDAPRPAKFLTDIDYPHFIEGVTLHNYNSFPSGHTTSAFALATILSLYVHNKRWGLLFLLMAIVAGYSRIYLSQHFLEDVTAGSAIGVAAGIFCATFLTDLLRRITAKRQSKVKTETKNF